MTLIIYSTKECSVSFNKENKTFTLNGDNSTQEYFICHKAISKLNKKELDVKFFAFCKTTFSAIAEDNSIYFFIDRDDNDEDEDGDENLVILPNKKNEVNFISLKCSNNRYGAISDTNKLVLWGNNYKDTCIYEDTEDVESVSFCESLTVIEKKFDNGNKLVFIGDDKLRKRLSKLKIKGVSKVDFCENLLCYLIDGELFLDGKTSIFSEDGSDEIIIKTIKSVEDFTVSFGNLGIVKNKKNKKSLTIYPSEFKTSVLNTYFGNNYNVSLEENKLMYSFYGNRENNFSNTISKYSEFETDYAKNLYDSDKIDELELVSRFFSESSILEIKKSLGEKNKVMKEKDVVSNYNRILFVMEAHKQYTELDKSFEKVFSNLLEKFPLLFGCKDIKNHLKFLNILKLLTENYMVINNIVNTKNTNENKTKLQKEISLIIKKKNQDDDDDNESDAGSELSDGSFVEGIDYDDEENRVIDESIIEETLHLYKFTKELINSFKLKENIDNITNNLETDKNNVNYEDDLFLSIIPFDNCFYVLTDKGNLLAFTNRNLSFFRQP